jgi:hypothetical protein
MSRQLFNIPDSGLFDDDCCSAVVQLFDKTVKFFAEAKDCLGEKSLIQCGSRIGENLTGFLPDIVRSTVGIEFDIEFQAHISLQRAL